MIMVRVMVFNATFNNISVYIVTVSVIGGCNRKLSIYEIRVSERVSE